jgi:sulfur relay (sulfurtransferase) DsrC/TusE family protein
VEYKKDQNWVRKSGNYFVFPGGGTQFKNGVAAYIRFIEQVDITSALYEILSYVRSYIRAFDLLSR